MKEKSKKKSSSKNLAVKIKEWLENYKPSLGRITVATLKDKMGENMVNQVVREWQELKFKKKFKEHFDTSQPTFTFYELLKFIDEEIPDEVLLNSLKLIFFNSIAKQALEQDEILGYQLLQVGKKLKSGDVMVLKACYDSKQMETFCQTNSAKQWLRFISSRLNLPIGLIETYEENLIRLKLLSDRFLADRSAVRNSPDGRLTDSGVKFCDFITKYPS